MDLLGMVASYQREGPAIAGPSIIGHPVVGPIDASIRGGGTRTMAQTLAYSSSRGGSDRTRLIRAVHAAALAFPLLPPAAEYGAYLLAWVKLGARPVPLLHDPTDILGPGAA